MKALVLIVFAIAGAAGQIKPPQQKVPYSPAPPRLEVREFSGDFTKWSLSTSIGNNAFVREFRWSTLRKDAAGGRLDIVAGLGKTWTRTLPVPQPLGAFGHFEVDFKPMFDEIATAPNQAYTFVLRVVVRTARGGDVAETAMVTVVYKPSVTSTQFDSAMAVILKGIDCFRTTDGPGSDEIKIRAIGWKPKGGGFTTNLHLGIHDELDQGDSRTLNAPLHTFTGPSFAPGISIIVGLAEDDQPIDFGNLPTGGTDVANGGDPVRALHAALCEREESDDDCIGDPQFLPVTAADWNKAVVKNQVVRKALTFKGDGAHYRLRFELRKAG